MSIEVDRSGLKEISSWRCWKDLTRWFGGRRIEALEGEHMTSRVCISGVLQQGAKRKMEREEGMIAGEGHARVKRVGHGMDRGGKG
ncbi:hypothetical protein K0M31_004877 [Melipona bicolor]|uniref:Uncharacterized protein n=1 Tax=Melipona bicolor TaxID=60889 RepID=A0AA40FWE2_9HYME|nr:hypothetical protein K0M31_004877 [Melipona bicolor]